MISDFEIKIQISYNNQKYTGNNKQRSDQKTIIRIIEIPNN